MGRKAYGAVEDYELEELVVALPDRDIVEKVLNNDLRVTAHTKEEDARLGLALLSLDNVAEAAEALQGQEDGLLQRVKDRKWPDRAKHPETESLALDVVLFKLREHFSEAYARWIPEVGKNRMISPVRGFPYVSGCAVGNPWQFGLDDPIPTPALAGGAPPGWAGPRPTEPGHGVRVGLLDTQLYPQEWLQGGYLATEKDLLRPPAPGDTLQALEGHGTFIAGLILRQAPGARLVVRPVMGHRALGQTWGVAKVMADFVGAGVHVLNLSFGCYTDDGEPPLVLAKAVSLLTPQILLVAAAGNHGNIDELRRKQDPVVLKAPWTTNLTDQTPVWPAALPQVTAVGATDEGNLADFTPKVPWIDVTAPGVDVESTYLTGKVRLSHDDDDPAHPGANPPTVDFSGYACWRGTSFATATVSGAVAAQLGSDHDAQQALESVLADNEIGIKRFPKPDGSEN